MVGSATNNLDVPASQHKRSGSASTGGSIGGSTTDSLVVTNFQSSDRTTRMLLAILLLFLITEFPSGILALLCGLLGENFAYYVYVNLGEVMDLLVLTNSAINFILYCTMSRKFRKTFTKLFCKSCSATEEVNAGHTFLQEGNGQRRARRPSPSVLDGQTCHTTCV
jgi:Serpentine type 7TM GPCR chemoreceptor Srw